MRSFLKIGIAVAAAIAWSTAANAAVTFTSAAFDAPIASGQTLDMTFDGPSAAGFSFSGGSLATGHGLYTAPPAGDKTQYLSARLGVTATLNTPILDSLSLYIGSVDPFNSITFIGTGGFSQTIAGSVLVPGANGDQFSGTTNRRFYFTFGSADDVNQIVFNSKGASFEFDNVAAAISAVPEPATWALMILGFGLVGGTLRSARRQQGALATA